MGLPVTTRLLDTTEFHSLPPIITLATSHLYEAVEEFISHHGIKYYQYAGESHL